MKWTLFLLLGLCRAKRYVVLFKDNLSAAAIQDHHQWIRTPEAGAEEVRSFSAPTLQGYIASFSEETAHQISQQPEILTVEENKEFRIQGFADTVVGWPEAEADLAAPLLAPLDTPRTAIIYGDVSESFFRGMHNVLKGRRHFRRNPVKKIYRRHRRRRHILLPFGLPAPVSAASTKNLLDGPISPKQMNTLFEKMHYPRAAEHLSIESTDSWGLSRLSQREHIYSLDTYIYPKNAGRGVTVFVLDTGIESDHPELKGKVDPGINLIDRNLDTEDDNGHGTHCAGIVAGSTRGVAKNARLVPVKILSGLGSGTTETTILGLVYVMKEHHRKLKTETHPRSVINMSLGGVKSAAMATVTSRAIQMGITVVVAGGNDAANACNFSPASIEEALTVGAIDQDDNIAQFSNTGECVNVYAPGVNIMSSYRGSIEKTLSGTSMATPHVAGLAALYLGEEYRTPAELKLLIQMDSFRSGLISIASSKILNLRLGS